MLPDFDDRGIAINDKQIIINASYFVKHDGYMQRTQALIHCLFNLRNQLKSKDLVFFLYDGEPIQISGFEYTIKKICTMLQIPENKIILSIIDHQPKIDFGQIRQISRHSGFFEQVKNLLKVDLCKLDPDYRLFGAFFGRFTLHRLLMAHYLATNHQDSSIVSFRPDYRLAEFEIDPFAKYFASHLDWLKSRLGMNPTLTADQASRNLSTYHEVFGKYAIEIVIETNIIDTGWFTEKTAKCLASGKPFILLGTQGQLAKLREMGFKTFSDDINESYDNEHCHEIRFEMICQQIAKLDGLDATAKTQLVKRLNSVSEYNKNNYHTLVNKYYATPL